jgi:hypothetical protein
MIYHDPCAVGADMPYARARWASRYAAAPPIAVTLDVPTRRAVRLRLGDVVVYDAPDVYLDDAAGYLVARELRDGPMSQITIHIPDRTGSQQQQAPPAAPAPPRDEPASGT